MCRRLLLRPKLEYWTGYRARSAFLATQGRVSQVLIGSLCATPIGAMFLRPWRFRFVRRRALRQNAGFSPKYATHLCPYRDLLHGLKPDVLQHRNAASEIREPEAGRIVLWLL